MDFLGLTVMEAAHQATAIEDAGWRRTLVPMPQGSLVMAIAGTGAEPSHPGDAAALSAEELTMTSV
jgi:hypothetical protein